MDKNYGPRMHVFWWPRNATVVNKVALFQYYYNSLIQEALLVGHRVLNQRIITNLYYRTKRGLSAAYNFILALQRSRKARETNANCIVPSYQSYLLSCYVLYCFEPILTATKIVS